MQILDQVDKNGTQDALLAQSAIRYMDIIYGYIWISYIYRPHLFIVDHIYVHRFSPPDAGQHKPARKGWDSLLQGNMLTHSVDVFRTDLLTTFQYSF